MTLFLRSGATAMAFLLTMYIVSSWMVFQWRNPKANQMSFYRDFGSVITWKKLDQYQ